MKSRILSAFALSLLAAPVLGQNKSLNDEVFSQNKSGDNWVQVALGAGDALAAQALFYGKFKSPAVTNPQYEAAKILVSEAEEALESARGLLSETEKVKLIEVLTADFNRLDELVTSYSDDIPTELSTQLENSSKKLSEAVSREVVTDAQKAAQLDDAAKNLAQARARLVGAVDTLPKVNTSKGPGLIQKGVRLLRVLGATVFVVDGASRIYIWNALEKDPTLSPVATFAWSKGVNAWESYLDAVARGEKPQVEEKK